LGTTYLEAAINGEDPGPKGNHYIVAAPHGCYRCQGEDRWCSITVRNDEEWKAFCRAIGRLELVGDTRFESLSKRLENRAELDRIVEAWTSSQPAHAVMTKLQTTGVPAGVVQTGADLLKDPQLRHRDYFAGFADSLIGPFEIPRSGFLFRGGTEEPLRLPSRFGSDNDSILSEILGYDRATIDRWRAEEVLT
ncbi:MAG TPA: CoA transferase, partial [Candidatus Binatia bacterium]|nr:CoA transferase [Candidatus Binatia bacterium]